MKQADCAICGGQVVKTHVCYTCKQTYDLSHAWAKKLIETERVWRNMQRRDDRHGFVSFSDITVFEEGIEYDGWDVLDGEVSYRGYTFDNVFANDLLTELRASSHHYADRLFDELTALANLSEREKNALYACAFLASGNKDTTSQEGASYLSWKEKKYVSPEAYRRRLADARRKIQEAIKRNSG